MEDWLNLEPKKYNAAPDQTCPNGHNHEIAKVSSTPTGEQATPWIEEAEADMCLEILAAMEGGEEGEAPTEGVVKKKQPPLIHQMALEGRRSTSRHKGAETPLHVNNDAPKWQEMYNRNVRTSPAIQHQIQEMSTQGPSNQASRIEQEGRQEEHLREPSLREKRVDWKVNEETFVRMEAMETVEEDVWSREYRQQIPVNTTQPQFSTTYKLEKE
ncbi:hypothetical protein NDU88_003298 [Pleurodeles waltl]|uniref:Uncharacterized protein n=1 Tax=Pleurodeles waltl TaxID=8319 RepID=A0AAV7NQI3_PLEWA|nr:hypothetical protein NDU88_003298 [Pleurodeles waltl]